MSDKAPHYRIVRYPDLVQPGAGHAVSEGYETREEAEKALLAKHPGKGVREIMAYAQERVEGGHYYP